MLEGAVVWDTSSRNEELILRAEGGKYIRVTPWTTPDGCDQKLVYDEVVEIAPNVWATVPDEYR